MLAVVYLVVFWLSSSLRVRSQMELTTAGPQLASFMEP